MSTTPTLNGQVIGQAHYATRALLDRAVAPLGLSFGQAIALNVLADGAVEQARLVHRITSTLKTDEQAVHEVIAHLVDATLVRVDDGTAEPQVRLTDAGHATRRRVGAAVADITTRLYGDIPTDEASVAAQVLTLVTQRANAELAALPA
ncbi:DNA-binding MarR family transcriptional regulator [Micromonospora luteifusca]|uniref:DNA-binding MarR family transcriptional regulator n=1 Tax=Micromonospora luteifusca TaxID=709860 RepID=A0ABS2M485_9ACTN|nr:winged helix DNA-binding protein [Micromonospora luteifusca]MBM7495150.1 DNA-binding MarR family transcriptional regulator [Micromonospora luteifusca]